MRRFAKHTGDFEMIFIIIEIILVIIAIFYWPEIGWPCAIGFLVLSLLIRKDSPKKRKKPVKAMKRLDQMKSWEKTPNVPSAPTSRWIEHEPLFGSNYFECANCHTKFDSAYTKCPKCGIVMSRRTKYSPDFIDECEFMDML